MWCDLAIARVNGVALHHEIHGAGEPLVLVHGSWGDASRWGLVVPDLAREFRVLVYDRRGHSRSERVAGQGSVDEDGDDLAALLEHVQMVPTHVVASSGGGNIALRLACRRPDLFRRLVCHEPPLLDLLADDPESRPVLERSKELLSSVRARLEEGDDEGGARLFADTVAFGPGAWDHGLPTEVRAAFVHNAATFLDELRDPDQHRIDVAARASCRSPSTSARAPRAPRTSVGSSTG
jgi:pimeloyl-ACP methyl ester carboxylesterase